VFVEPFERELESALFDARVGDAVVHGPFLANVADRFFCGSSKGQQDVKSLGVGEFGEQWMDSAVTAELCPIAPRGSSIWRVQLGSGNSFPCSADLTSEKIRGGRRKWSKDLVCKGKSCEKVVIKCGADG
jgi:hypothetical protein